MSKKKKLLKTNFVCVVSDPRIYENSIFPAYFPEKNKIITPWQYQLIGNVIVSIIF